MTNTEKENLYKKFGSELFKSIPSTKYTDEYGKTHDGYDAYTKITVSDALYAFRRAIYDEKIL